MNVTYGDHTAVLSLRRHEGNQKWLLTGWDNLGFDDSKGVNPSAAYASQNPGISSAEGAKPSGIVPQSAGKEKLRTDPATTTAFPFTDLAHEPQRSVVETVLSGLFPSRLQTQGCSKRNFLPEWSWLT